MKGTEHRREEREHSKKFTFPTCKESFGPAGSFFSLYFFGDAEHVRQECCLATEGEQPVQGEGKGEGIVVALIAPFRTEPGNLLLKLFSSAFLSPDKSLLSLSLSLSRMHPADELL